MRTYYVYILASRSHVLYTGVTSDLARRVEQHKTGGQVGFTCWYKVNRLVYFETFADLREAIAREKRIKGWSRAKKIRLIQGRNPGWMDMARDWFTDRSALSFRVRLHPSP